MERKSFNKLIDANNYAGKYENSFVFSYEVGRGGVRNFLVSDLRQFWDVYKNLRLKTHYEVIRYPLRSKLYFDLEFLYKENEGKNGYIMCQKLISCVNNLLLSDHKYSVKNEEVMILEATTEKKFSLHVIYTKTIFQSNISIKWFVKKLLSRMDVDEISLFTCVNKNGKDSSFIDERVYDKSRNFRLLLSQKLGQTNPFRLSKKMVEYGNYNKTFLESDESNLFSLFCSSLVTNISPDATIIRTTENDVDEIVMSGTFSSSSKSFVYSTFPEIEAVIKSQLECPGTITKCKYYPNIVIYSIGGTRYCAIARRSHTRNHIFYQYNVSTNELQQRCFSEECRGYFQSIVIPPSTMMWLQNIESWS